MLPHTPFLEKAQTVLQTSFHEGRAYVYYVDLAQLKGVNRLNGMERDGALHLTAAEYISRIPEAAACERIFSDQFAILAITRETRSKGEMARAYDEHAEAFLSKQGRILSRGHMQIHCGIAPVERKESLADALDNAYTACRHAGNHGTNHGAMVKKDMAGEMDDLERFIFYLQPKVNVESGEIIGSEALTRLIREGTVIPPEAFIPIMEKNGSILELDQMMLRKVCAHMAQRLLGGLPVVRTSVNLSRLHIREDEAKRLHDIVREYGIPPHLLEFELTESIPLNEFAGAAKFCDQLRGYGYTVSIDDYGAGYTGMNILQELNFDVLKLDKRFLSDREPLKSRNRIILPDMLRILRKLHIDALCEGVETAEQCRYLAGIGCSKAQGYYFSPPVPPEEFYDMYETIHGRYEMMPKGPAVG
ncbi:EAL domain-containing protein [Gehongia tenuis]|uniref:EAL domain-containing protein n=1 Tax=Gehongia tenuis TaxID=2763655 RepID=A0A926D5W2_9FIRM|nr:EAL domain-containing protein [Gehongia tenuis]MBC8531912.1 EAL domain-containing protein [Gehongia tenuis]